MRRQPTLLNPNILFNSILYLIPVCLAIITTGQMNAPTFAQEKQPIMQIQLSDFGTTPEGQTAVLYTLTNSQGNVVQLTNYGAIITKVELPDRSGQKANVTLAFPTLEGYLERHPYFGATVGRFANRIAGGKFQIDGQSYSLATNIGPNHLHGGNVGFDKKLWQASWRQTNDALIVTFTTVSPDGEEGYPGRLEVTAEYLWNNENELTFAFSATTDKPTVLNLTNHAYWNLAGAGNGNILGTQLQLFCDRYLSVDETLIPTGQLTSVEGTPLDFRQAKSIGQRIEMLPQTKGYDHCFVVNGTPGSMRPAARAVEPGSGRVMEVFTTQPGMQLYTGNHLSGSVSNGGFQQHDGFCLETQHFPDSPNRPEFPSTLLRPGEKFYQATMHRFGLLK